MTWIVIVMLWFQVQWVALGLFYAWIYEDPLLPMAAAGSGTGAVVGIAVFCIISVASLFHGPISGLAGFALAAFVNVAATVPIAILAMRREETEHAAERAESTWTKDILEDKR